RERELVPRLAEADADAREQLGKISAGDVGRLARAHGRAHFADAAPRAAAHAGTERDEEVAPDVGFGHRRQPPIVGHVDRHAAAAGAGADAAAEAEAAADVGVHAPAILDLHADAPREVRAVRHAGRE